MRTEMQEFNKGTMSNNIITPNGFRQPSKAQIRFMQTAEERKQNEKIERINAISLQIIDVLKANDCDVEEFDISCKVARNKFAESFNKTKIKDLCGKDKKE